jgi:hypothetical protein
LQTTGCYVYEFDARWIDGTDTAGAEEMVSCIRYIKNNSMIEVFLSILHLNSATADGYLDTNEKAWVLILVTFQSAGQDQY